MLEGPAVKISVEDFQTASEKLSGEINALLEKAKEDASKKENAFESTEGLRAALRIAESFNDLLGVLDSDDLEVTPNAYVSREKISEIKALLG